MISSLLPDASAQTALWLTLKLALTTTVLLLIVSIPMAWSISQSRSSFLRSVSIATVNLPLVLPPTVLGFYLLLALGPHGWISLITDTLGLPPLRFSFGGLVLGSMIFSLPFAVQPILFAFEALGKRPLEVAATLRARPMDTFFSVVLPQCKAGILIAGILTFAHTIGEFGVVLMIGGNIEGKTRVLSTQIYTYVEAMEYHYAHLLAMALLVFSFIILLMLNLISKKHSYTKYE